MLLISLTMTACTLCSYAGTRRPEPFRSCISLDLERLTGHHILEIGFGHSINENWAICAAGALNIGAMTEQDSSDRNLITNIIEMQYWPAGTFSGPMLSLGMESSLSRAIYPFAEIGYSCRIWKGLIVGLGYRAGLSDKLQGGRQSSEGIRIKAYFGF